MRFVSQDIFPGYASRSASLNKFVYAENTPINHNDPTGKHVSLGEMSFTQGLVGDLVTLSNNIGTASRAYTTISNFIDVLNFLTVVFNMTNSIGLGFAPNVQNTVNDFSQTPNRLASMSNVSTSFAANWTKILSVGMPNWGPALYKHSLAKPIPHTK